MLWPAAVGFFVQKGCADSAVMSRKGVSNEPSVPLGVSIGLTCRGRPTQREEKGSGCFLQPQLIKALLMSIMCSSQLIARNISMMMQSVDC